MATDRILRIRDAGPIIGMCANTIRHRAAHNGDLPRHFRSGTGRTSAIMFRLSDVNRWMEQRLA